MSLIPEAASIKAELLQADNYAHEISQQLCNLQTPSYEAVAPLLCEYIGFKYMIPGTITPEETLESAGERSLEEVKKKGNTVEGMDVLPHCGSASSATHKKILLQLALQKDLEIKIQPRDGANCETVSQLAALISELLTEKLKSKGAAQNAEGES